MKVTRLKHTMAASGEVSVDTQIASVSSLKEEQRTTLKAFIDGKDVFALLTISFSLVGVFLVNVHALFQTVSTDGFPDGSV